jgi:hypothetical protein
LSGEALILRDAAKTPLLRMREKMIYTLDPNPRLS